MDSETRLRASINGLAMKKVTRFFNATTEAIIGEMLQNARRAGATKVQITTEAEAVTMGAFPISRSRAHTHRRHGHPLQTVPSAGLIERPQEKNRVDALR